MNFFEYAEEYLKRCDWKDLALVKFCLCAIGILIGLAVPKEKKAPFLIGSAIIFIATYIPLMYKFIGIISEKNKDKDEITF